MKFSWVTLEGAVRMDTPQTRQSVRTVVSQDADYDDLPGLAVIRI
jgi:hypothetical protein